VLADGKEFSFWKEKWLGMESFLVTFPNLFSKAYRPNGVVEEMGIADSNGWTWRLSWNDSLSASEAVAERHLLDILLQVQLSHATMDRRKWIPAPDGIFTVKSTYICLQSQVVVTAIDELKVTALKKLWKNKVPSKVSIFGWRLLLEKLPTREVLFQRDIITNTHETCCVFCFDLMESIDHIFLTCRVTATVWSLIFGWMGIQGSSARNIQQHFLWFGDLLKGKHSKRVKHIIWLATMWSLWRTRNNIIFRGDFVNVQSLVDQIVYISWFWFISRVGTNVNFVFSDWCNNPLKCLHSTICRSL
jgi:hypothetical protein